MTRALHRAAWVIYLAILLLVAFGAQAAPFVVSDPSTTLTVTHCAWYLDSAAREQVVAPKDSLGKPYCTKDLAAVTTGAHSIQASFVIVDPIWGSQEGPKSDPFAFTRPAAPPKPLGMELVP